MRSIKKLLAPQEAFSLADVSSCHEDLREGLQIVAFGGYQVQSAEAFLFISFDVVELDEPSDHARQRTYEVLGKACCEVRVVIAAID